MLPSVHISWAMLWKKTELLHLLWKDLERADRHNGSTQMLVVRHDGSTTMSYGQGGVQRICGAHAFCVERAHATSRQGEQHGERREHQHGAEGQAGRDQPERHDDRDELRNGPKGGEGAALDGLFGFTDACDDASDG